MAILALVPLYGTFGGDLNRTVRGGAARAGGVQETASEAPSLIAEQRDQTKVIITLQVTAKKYEFNPKVIDVKQGEHIKLVITATDHDHGFECGEFHINQLLKKGQPATIEFTADKAGTFPFRCSHFCGMGHLKMKGQIIVAASQ